MLSRIKDLLKLGQLQMKQQIIFIRKVPKLKSPHLVAGWPGMGNVAIKAIEYIQKKLNAVPFAKIEPGDLFQTPMVHIRDNTVGTIDRPQSTFYYYQSQNASNDLILFLGEAQPVPGKEFYLGQMVTDLQKKFQGKRVYTIAATPTSMHHRESPKVWAVPTHKELFAFLKEFNLKLTSSGQISGMNGLLLGMAKREKIQGICLLGEIPQYTVNIDNPKSCLAVLKTLSRMLGIDLDFKELEELATQKDNEIDFYIQQIRDDLEKELSSKKPEKAGYLH
jgi:proteasome assembly chaperone (PAC2) family protein